MSDRTNAQVALEAASRAVAPGTSPGHVTNRAAVFLTWLNEQGLEPDVARAATPNSMLDTRLRVFAEDVAAYDLSADANRASVARGDFAAFIRRARSLT
jgi:hypothetical protein